jgi:hypothetical protein
MAGFIAYPGNINAGGENTGKCHDLIHGYRSAKYAEKGKHTRLIIY